MSVKISVIFGWSIGYTTCQGKLLEFGQIYELLKFGKIYELS